jgi:pilus assembly protein Flp/PilA
MKTILARFGRDESGVTAIEYGLIAGLVSIVIITSAIAIGTNVAAVFMGISAQLAATP